jgi:CheY-like chemotaxis protein
MCPPSDRSRPLSVLIVDDIHDTADSLAVLVGLEGHAVHTAYDAESARSVAQAHPIDVVLIDIAMPKCDGYTLAGRLRDVLPAKPRFVAVTGFGQHQDLERSRREGFAHHFIKPVDLPALLRLLASFRAESPGSRV